MNNNIAKNISAIRDRIIQSCKNSGRNPEEVKLLLATKKVLPEDIKLAFQQGETLIGENKVQELKEKYEALRTIPHTKHFIGHLQTNKVKDVLKCGVSCIQSIDRFELAEKLQKRLEYESKKIDVLIQVNTSYEESKFGISPKEVLSFVKKISCLNNLKINGLMTIGIFSNDESKIRTCFRLLKNIQQEIINENIPNVKMNELSMGMSEDLEIAIEEGSTMIRVGTAIFGQRN